MAGDVDHFSDEKKAGHSPRFHCLGRKFVGIDAARGHFRFSVTLGPFRLDLPRMQLTLCVGEVAIGVARQGIGFEPAIRKAAREDFSQQRFPTRRVVLATRAQFSGEVAAGRKVEMNRLLAIPVRRDLQNRRPAESMMSEKHVFPKREGRLFRRASGSNHLGRDSREIAPALAIPFAEDERDQGGACGLDLQAKLVGQIVTKCGGADFRNGQTSGRDHQAGHIEAGVLGLDGELGVLECTVPTHLVPANLVRANLGHFRVEPDFHSGIAAFLLQHRRDVARRSIAEQLAELFLVI